MTTAYPGAVDNFSNPPGATSQDDPSYLHSAQHANANDAVEAIETELGTTPSGDYATVKARLDDLDVTKVIVSATEPDAPSSFPSATWIWLETP